VDILALESDKRTVRAGAMARELAEQRDGLGTRSDRHAAGENQNNGNGG
jgi:hypothetical protein